MSAQPHEATAFPPAVGQAVAALSGYLEVSSGTGLALRRAAAASARAELIDAHPLAVPQESATSGDPHVAWQDAIASVRDALASSADPVEIVHLANAAEILEEAAAPR